jgi:hypothetical protein
MSSEMSYETITVKGEVEAVDIPTMREMSIHEYETYLRGGLLFVDHHDILRSAPAEYPLATTKQQLRALIRYLEEIEPMVGSS